MSFPSPEVEELRLKTRLEGAIKHAADINERALEVYAEVAKEKTHYFEKIALGSGATIALLVSFVGSHMPQLLTSPSRKKCRDKLVNLFRLRQPPLVAEWNLGDCFFYFSISAHR